MAFQLDLSLALHIPLSQLWATLSPQELSLYRIKWAKGHFGGWADDLRHGIQCVASGGGKKARDWMLDPPKEKVVSYEVGMSRMSAQINAQMKSIPKIKAKTKAQP